MKVKDDFDKIYDKIYSQFKDKIEILYNTQKEVKKYTLKKLIKPIIIIATIFLILVLITKNIEILFLLLFVPGPLIIYYWYIKGVKIRTTITPNMDITDQIYDVIVNEGFEGLTYCHQKKGIDKEIYDNGYPEDYDKYYSVAELEGMLNSTNKFQMSFISTTKEYWDSNNRSFKDIHWIFRGYFLDIELSKPTNMHLKINERKSEYINEQTFTIKNDNIANNIQNILKEFRKATNIASDCAIINDKLYVRVSTNSYDTQELNRLLDKETLKKYYDGIHGILELTNKILKCINENKA